MQQPHGSAHPALSHPPLSHPAFSHPALSQNLSSSQLDVPSSSRMGLSTPPGYCASPGNALFQLKRQLHHPTVW